MSAPVIIKADPFFDQDPDRPVYFTFSVSSVQRFVDQVPFHSTALEHFTYPVTTPSGEFPLVTCVGDRESLVVKREVLDQVFDYPLDLFRLDFPDSEPFPDLGLGPVLAADCRESLREYVVSQAGLSKGSRT